MKQEYKYALYLVGALSLLVLIEYVAPKPVDWAFTLMRRDKIPYGTYVLNALLDDIFPNQTVTHSRSTLYELDSESLSDANLLVLATQFSSDSLDARVLLHHAERGGHALIAANFYYGVLADTLNLDVDTRVLPSLSDTSPNDSLPEQPYDQTYFTSYDTARTTVLAYDEDDHPILLRARWGEGALILSSTPYHFTNYHLLREGAASITARTLSFLPVRDVYWTEYYQTGRMEATTPLRYVLSQPPLRWALYLILAGLILFMLLESKRKQRAIPVVNPLTNTTLEFVDTISNLFLRTRDHRNIAQKRIRYFLEALRTRYRLDTSTVDEAFKHRLQHKSGREETEVDALLSSIRHAQQQDTLSAEELVQLSQRIDVFLKKEAVRDTAHPPV